MSKNTSTIFYHYSITPSLHSPSLVPSCGRDTVHALRAAKFRPEETIGCDDREAEHRHNKTTREIVFVSHGAHHLRENGSAHDRHDNEGGCFLRFLAKTEDAEGENCREHDRHEEVGQKNRDHRDPAQLEEDDDAKEHTDRGVEPEH